MVESSDKTWSTGEGNGKPLLYSFLENPINSMKNQKDRILKDELPRSVGAQYPTGDQWRNNSPKRYPYKYKGLECKSRKPGVIGKFGLGIHNEAGQRLIEFCQENTLVIENILFQQHKKRLYT